MNPPPGLIIYASQSPDFAILPPNSTHLMQEGADKSGTGALMDQ